MTLNFPRDNNLDWLRLVFAIQVLVVHSAEHMDLRMHNIFYYFPGVPAFFFVSGFLIYASYLNSPGWKYFKNRFFRIFPALLFVTLGAMGVALIAKGWDNLFDNSLTYFSWFFAQITLGQAYNPSLFRDIGVGVLNGSLWTISTEILFYFFVPVIVWMEKRFRFTVILTMVISYIIYCIGPLVFKDPIYRDKTFSDILELTPIAWGWMFGFGILAVKNYNWIQKWIKYFPYAIAPLILMILYGQGVLFRSYSNHLGLFYFICYGLLLIWIAFQCPHFRLPFDFSYGVYVWHMPIINLFLVLGIANLPLAWIVIFMASAISWFFVEKPIMKFKHNSLRIS